MTGPRSATAAPDAVIAVLQIRTRSDAIAQFAVAAAEGFGRAGARLFDAVGYAAVAVLVHAHQVVVLADATTRDLGALLDVDAVAVPAGTVGGNTRDSSRRADGRRHLADHEAIVAISLQHAVAPNTRRFGLLREVGYSRAGRL